MKKNKHILIIILLISLIIMPNKAYAEEKSDECYYMTDDIKIKLDLTWNYRGNLQHRNYVDAYVNKKSSSEVILNVEKDIKNLTSNKNKYGINIPKLYTGYSDVNQNLSCPKYVMLVTNENDKNYKIFATNDSSISKDVINAAKAKGKNAFSATYTNSKGTKTTAEEYYGTFIDTKTVGKDATITCSGLLGNKNDKESFAYLINEALSYIRIIVPILLILLGTIDFAKAVLASKEDEMKKAQETFIKRAIIALAVFFVPTLVDIVMELAETVWEGAFTTCSIK